MAVSAIRWYVVQESAAQQGLPTPMMGNVRCGVLEEESERYHHLPKAANSNNTVAWVPVGAAAQGKRRSLFPDVEDDVSRFVQLKAVSPTVTSKEVVATQFTGGLRAGMGYCGAEKYQGIK